MHHWDHCSLGHQRNLSALASAAQLTITDDVCTTTLSEAEVETALRIFEDAGHTLVAEMKKLLPSVAADIDAVMAAEDADHSERRARIEAAGINAGLDPDEPFLLIFLARILLDSEALGNTLEPETLTKQEAAELLAQWNDGILIGDEEQPWSAPARVLLTKTTDTLAPVLNLEKTLFQACVDGEPGTYNLNTGGGGGGNTDLPGSSGSSGFSFGSS